ncbi:hypothetical protein F4780DRAFT_509352 [Xylariomycetidae sp. FL0641]|nr:hypothetical protein F4780DRAFT_509352 [Xylariomycetidae sp. FL0641]
MILSPQHFATLCALLCTLVPRVHGSFWLYYLSITDATGAHPHKAYGFRTSTIDCPWALDHLNVQPEKSDVSGTKTGVRCEGCQDGANPTVFEWNNEMGHFTAYADRDWAMVDLGNTVRGQCTLDYHQFFECLADDRRIYGRSKLYCESSELDAELINK